MFAALSIAVVPCRCPSSSFRDVNLDLQFKTFLTKHLLTIDLPNYQYHRDTDLDEYLLQTQVERSEIPSIGGETYRFGLSLEAGETVVNRNQSNTTHSKTPVGSGVEPLQKKQ